MSEAANCDWITQLWRPEEKDFTTWSNFAYYEWNRQLKRFINSEAPPIPRYYHTRRRWFRLYCS